MTNTSKRSYLWLFCLLAVTGICLDLASKYAVFAWLQRDRPGEYGQYELIPGAFELLTQYTTLREADHASWLSPLRTWSSPYLPRVNHGALFGLGGKFEHLANGVFASISVVAALAIIFWSTRRSTASDVLLCATLGLILAGTIGNLYDRVVFGGVRDFLHWHRWFEWPVFNIADCCLVCGSALLFRQAFWPPPDPASKTADVKSAVKSLPLSTASQSA